MDRMNAAALATPLAGGALIGLASAGVLLFEGRIAGISGMLAGVLSPESTAERGIPLAFVLGLVAGGLAAFMVSPGAFGPPMLRSPLALVAAGLLVGVGTRVGGGCTSGHGICGIGRLSRRSIVATITFMATGAIAALSVRLLGGGA